jgi:hypothetical protein
MKKNISLLALLFLLVFSACESLVEAEKDPLYDSILLKVGNEYFFRHALVGGQDSIFAVIDWYETKTITSDTIINFKEYFRFNSNELYLNENKTLYSLVNNSETIQLDYNVNIGDTTHFLNNKVIIQDISDEIIFGETQKKYTVSNEELSDSMLITGVYYTKFGLFFSGAAEGNYTSSQYLMKVTIDGKVYGK